MSTANPAEFHPYDPDFAADPYPVYARLRDESPIFWSTEVGATLLTRFDDVRSLVLDRRVGRTMDHLKTAEEIAAQRSAEDWARLPNYSRYVRVNLLEKEGHDHARLRRLVAAALDPRRMRAQRGRIEALVEELFAARAGERRMDFLEDLAVPLPVYMISELLGWPKEERHRLRPWSAEIIRLYEHDHSAADEARAEAAATDFSAMLTELADRRRVEPRDDLISAMVSISDAGDRLSRDELISTCMLLLIAGHEATVNASGNGLYALLRHPAQLARLRDDPRLVTNAIEEILRYESPLQLFHRHVLEPLEIGGIAFEKGDVVGLLYGCANRDPRAFERADEFDITRAPGRHMAFGAGNHFCLGAPLARLELEILFTTLLRRAPAIELDGERPEYRPGLVFRGLKRLRVRW